MLLSVTRLRKSPNRGRAGDKKKRLSAAHISGTHVDEFRRSNGSLWMFLGGEKQA